MFLSSMLYFYYCTIAYYFIKELSPREETCSNGYLQFKLKYTRGFSSYNDDISAVNSSARKTMTNEPMTFLHLTFS